MATAADAKQRTNVLRQIEYYLSDVALPYDDFFLNAYNEGGDAIPIATLADSPRIKQMLASHSADERAALIKELVEGESDSLKLAERDPLKVTRTYPLPTKDEAAPRSVYLGGVAKHLDEEALKSGLERATGAESYLPILSIRRLRDLQRDRSYSGMIFVECESAEKAEALMKAAMRNGCGVVCMKAKLLSDFYERQHASVLEQRQKMASKKRPRAEDGESGGAAGSAPAIESAEEVAAREAAEAAAKAAQAIEERKLVLRFEGIVGEEVGREEVTAAVAKAAPSCKVAYIDFSRGEATGHIRFENAEGCAGALSALTAEGASVDVGGAAPTWRMLSEEESASYWQVYHDRQAEKRGNKKPRFGGGKGGGKGKGKGKGKGWGKGKGKGKGGGD